jgi:tRNA A-37 threonylcarbamoyl transferase component Bud32
LAEENARLLDIDIPLQRKATGGVLPAADPHTEQDAVPSAIEIADAVLEIAARPNTVALLLDPGPKGHEISLVRSGRSRSAGWVPCDIGDAVAARIALLAGLDIPADGERFGRLPLAIGDRNEELIVFISNRPRGLAIEVRRVRAPAEALQSGDPARRMLLPAPGTGLGHYHLFEEIGRGAAGVVFRGEHTGLRKSMAIKILRPEFSQDPEQVVRFFNEARASSQVHHPGIVAATDCGITPDGLAYLAMELVEWPTLAALLTRGPLLAERAVDVARSVAEALDQAHEAGIVHRDLKPANIFVGAMDRAKIADFGAAKLMRCAWGGPSDTQRGLWFGTPLYMSPEHARGISTDRRTDIYGLGCIFFEMLTGRVPYEGTSAAELVLQHASAPIPRAVGHEGPLPPMLQKTLQRALAKHTGERYQTARELLADLDRCAAVLERKGWRAWLPT